MGEPDFMDEEYFEEMEHLEEIDERTVIVRLGDHIGNLLIENGFSHIDYVREASDEELLAISGIGRSTLKIIRDTLAAEALLDERAGVSERPATTDSEVKPDSMEAEAAEVGIAEPASVVEADAESGTLVVRSLWPSHIKLIAPSGLEYEWPRAGAEVHVLATDIGFVMGKNRNVGRACCGSSSERLYFQTA